MRGSDTLFPNNFAKDLFKMVVNRHRQFSNSADLNCRRVVEMPDPSSFQISSKSIKQLWIYCDFSIFQDGGWQAGSHLGFLNSGSNTFSILLSSDSIKTLCWGCSKLTNKGQINL